MHNVLIILAHPKSDSLNHSIANLYRQEKEAQGKNVELLDLYKCDVQQKFFTFEDTNKPEFTQEMKYFQNKIDCAQELVFVFPYWWGSSPAILKNFLDWNFSKDFAFTYENSRPVGLLDKQVTVFTTTGAPSLVYTITGANRRLKKMWKDQIINFCGMKLKSFNIYGGVDTNKKNIENILEKVQQISQ